MSGKRVIDGEQLTAGGVEGFSNNLENYDSAHMTVHYTKGSEAEMTLELSLSNGLDEDGSEIYAQETEFMEDGVTQGTKDATQVIRKFAESGIYRFSIPKSPREDFIKAVAKASGGATPYGTVIVSIDV